MKLQDQVCTKEQAQRLKELGVEARMTFIFFQAASHSGIALFRGATGKRDIWAVTGVPYEDDELTILPAFNTTELGRAIGSGTFAAQKFHDAVMSKINASYSMTIATAPQFVASFLIAAIEAGVVKVEEVNQRLK